MPSGLTIYESFFHGKRGILGGPHEVFTNVERQFKGIHLISHVYFTETVEKYRLGCITVLGVPLPGYQDDGEMGTEHEKSLCNSYAAKRPPMKIKIFDDIENSGTEITYRCVECRNCPECKKGGKIESISIQEEIEQHLINHSVDVDIRKAITIAKLPFIFNPSSKLLRNENVAWKAYQGQVKKLDKSPEDKLTVISSERKLHDLGFVEFFNDMCENDKNMILRNEVQYFIPWKSVWNSISLGTSCRLVFDASQAEKTGVSLNSLLANGINIMNRLVEIKSLN